MTPDSDRAVPWRFVLVVIAIAFVGTVTIPYLPPVRRCVVEGTLVATPSGPRPIESLRVGDQVDSRRPDGRESVSEVVAVVEARSDSSLELTFANGARLQVTASHPIASRGAWIEAGSLHVGDRVEALEGPTTVTGIVARDRSVRVFDISVAPDPCFFAGGILVHNKTSNESAALGALKTVATSEGIYHEKYEPPTYASLAELSSARLVDSVLGSGTKQGYLFVVLPSSTAPASGWVATANPAIPRTTGDRYFVTNQDGVIFYTTAAPFVVDPSTCAIPRNAVQTGK